MNNLNTSQILKTFSLSLVLLISFYPIVDNRVQVKDSEIKVSESFVESLEYKIAESVLKELSVCSVSLDHVDKHFFSITKNKSTPVAVILSRFIENDLSFHKVSKVGLYILYSALKISPFNI